MLEIQFAKPRPPKAATAEEAAEFRRRVGEIITDYTLSRDELRQQLKELLMDDGGPDAFLHSEESGPCSHIN